MLRCGLLGEKLGHSYSPAIHAMLGDYEYRLYEKTPAELPAFLADGVFDALNVTIPYKKTVLPYCDALSDAARALGSVNVLLRRADGTLFGDNTDLFGFESMVRGSGIAVAGKKALVLGSGGASVTVCAVLRKLGAASVTVISRRGGDNYTNLDRHRDARLVVNTTPVGMYPGNGTAPVDLRAFPACEGVLDIVYNPARTALMLQAERLGIPAAGGLPMLVAQAKRGSELFTGHVLEDDVVPRICRAMSLRTQNIVLIGMPGCGKTTVGALLAEALGRPAEDADACVERAAGCSVPEVFAREGEDGFRIRETAALTELGRRSGIVLSTGGGCVLRPENYDLLHQNGVIFWLCRALDRLPAAGRPLSLDGGPARLYERREPCYRRFADYLIDNNGAVEDTVRQIREVLA